MKYYYLLLPILFLSVVALVISTLIGNHTVALLEPKGLIAEKEAGILKMYFTIGAFIAIAVFSLTFYIVWNFRQGNNAKYSPDWTSGKWLQFAWWAIPSVIIAVLALLSWQSTHALDPYKPIRTGTKPLEIQVIAMRWKWLFIYPEQKIATVNFVQFPENTPLDFRLTADAPMNSFWIPQLGGQIYAMAGMSTQHHLIANSLGDFQGSAAEINGKGFAGMKFTARSSTQTDFDKWVSDVKNSPKKLDLISYDELAKPSEYNDVTTYLLTEPNLYSKVMMRFMPQPSMKPMEDMP